MSTQPILPPQNTLKITTDILSKTTKTAGNDAIAYKNLSIVIKLSKGKFPVYLVSSKANKQRYVMKVFNYIGEQPHPYYNNEIRFASFKHPNVIDMIHSEENKDTLQKGERKKISYILMDYAPHGDFLGFINDHYDHINEKLARTYFRQLIEGIEHLHTSSVAHLDLKPENLLLGADFNLKIADFDLSHIQGDEKILSRGTRFYRAPELYQPTSSSSTGSTAAGAVELDDPFAADIYSAGVMLFILKSGTYPHSENGLSDGVCFADLMYEDNHMFWTKHCETQGIGKSFYNREFRELFNGMVKADPKERLSIKQIKESKWYNGPVYSSVELQREMKKLLRC